MTDVGEVEDVKSPESMMAVMSSSPREQLSPHSSAPLQSQSGELDSWIEVLSKCNQLPEEDVKRLCDKVTTNFINSYVDISRHEKYYMKNQTFNQYDVQSPSVVIFTANFMTYKNSSA